MKEWYYRDMVLTQTKKPEVLLPDQRVKKKIINKPRDSVFIAESYFFYDIDAELKRVKREKN